MITMEDYSVQFVKEKTKKVTSDLDLQEDELLNMEYTGLQKVITEPEPEEISPDEIIRRQLKHLKIMEALQRVIIRAEKTKPSMRTIQLSKYIVDSYGRIYEQMKGKTINYNNNDVKKFDDDPELKMLEQQYIQYVEKLKKDGKLRQYYK